MTAIRAQILAAIKTALEGVDAVGLVVPAGRREAELFAPHLAAGDAVIEMAVGEDQVQSDYVGPLIDKAFVVYAYVHLPDDLPDGESVIDAACRYYADVVALLESESDPAVGTWGGLALETRDNGGGGVGLDPELGTDVTAVMFEVRYRHRRGNAGAAA